MSHRLWPGLSVPPPVGHGDLPYAARKGPPPPRLLWAGCKSNMGDVEQRARGGGGAWPAFPAHRAPLNPLLVPPSQQLHPRALLLPTSPAVAIPLRDGGTQGWGHAGVAWAPAVGPKELGAPLPQRSPLCPSEPAVCLQSPGGLASCPPWAHGSLCCSSPCWHLGLCSHPSDTGTVGMERRMLLG